MNAKEYLDSNRNRILETYRGRLPDCFIVYRTHPDRGVTGPALAIFQNFESLYGKLQRIADELDKRFGIDVASCWFDDSDD